jgi:hypothetical protein
MNDTNTKGVELRNIFLGLQGQMITKLSTNREIISHPGIKGDATELSWLEMLSSYLPKRYQVDKAFVLDANGQLSDQIDIVIFDRQYSPFLFNQNGALYIPAESVYGIIEVKQDLNKENIEYAGSKASSVRRLHRTSAPIPHVGGVYPPKPHFEILAGILCLGSTWNPPLGVSLESAIEGISPQERINLGCALQYGAFEVTYPDESKPIISKSGKEDSLIFFFLHLLSSLQKLGTAPALDIAVYANSLKNEMIESEV